MKPAAIAALLACGLALAVTACRWWGRRAVNPTPGDIDEAMRMQDA